MTRNAMLSLLWSEAETRVERHASTQGSAPLPMEECVLLALVLVADGLHRSADATEEMNDRG